MKFRAGLAVPLDIPTLPRPPPQSNQAHEIEAKEQTQATRRNGGQDS